MRSPRCRSDQARAEVETFVHLLAPCAPFITEEIWSRWGYTTSIHAALARPSTRPWPRRKRSGGRSGQRQGRDADQVTADADGQRCAERR
ncbi:MAG: class I tRNA ligase family protein [Anaerolineae bacterium]|nr:class I tRNA ligase family protein [Anaerolineae bacterium]